ncbi:MAG: hypothetical protein AAF384_15115 [Pseudomonadota bacterium]
MISLSKVLAAKICITLLAWAMPLLLFPSRLLIGLGFPAPQPEIFLRLLGVAYLALVLGYVLGYQKLKTRQYPLETIWVGIVSNGGATILLLLFAFDSAWTGWGWFAQAYMWFSLVSVDLITAGLVLQGAFQRRHRDTTLETAESLGARFDARNSAIFGLRRLGSEFAQLRINAAF